MVSIATIILLGLGSIFTFLFVRQAAATSLSEAGSELGMAIGDIGQGVGESGRGIASFGQGVGAGITGLFAPLKFFQELIFGNEPIVQSENPNTVHAMSSGSATKTFQGQLGTSVIQRGSLTGGLI